MHSEHYMKRWEELRRYGIVGYTIRYGLLRWGVIVFLTLIVVNHSIKHGSLYSVFNQFDISIFVSVLVLTSIAGVLYGVITWNISENSYRKNIKHD